MFGSISSRINCPMSHWCEILHPLILFKVSAVTIRNPRLGSARNYFHAQMYSIGSTNLTTDISAHGEWPGKFTQIITERSCPGVGHQQGRGGGLALRGRAPPPRTHQVPGDHLQTTGEGEIPAWEVRVQLNCNESEGDIASRWVHRESNSIVILSKEKVQRKTFA